MFNPLCTVKLLSLIISNYYLCLSTLTVNVSSSSNYLSLLTLEACAAVLNPALITLTSVHLSLCFLSLLGRVCKISKSVSSAFYQLPAEQSKMVYSQAIQPKLLLVFPSLLICSVLIHFTSFCGHWLYFPSILHKLLEKCPSMVLHLLCCLLLFHPCHLSHPAGPKLTFCLLPASTSFTKTINSRVSYGQRSLFPLPTAIPPHTILSHLLRSTGSLAWPNQRTLSNNPPKGGNSGDSVVHTAPCPRPSQIAQHLPETSLEHPHFSHKPARSTPPCLNTASHPSKAMTDFSKP